MAKLSSMFPSRFVRSEDIQQPCTLVIRGITRENVAPDNQAEEIKPVAYFERAPKGLVLNHTNAAVLMDLFGDDTEAMQGRTVELYVDHNVQFQGKQVSGLRLRAPAENAETSQPIPTTTEVQGEAAAMEGDDIPF